MKKMHLVLAGGIGAAMLMGCATSAKFDYAAAKGVMATFHESGLSQKTIAVLPFLDVRDEKYSDPLQKEQAKAHPAGDHGSFHWGFVPLLPAGWVERETPEKSKKFVTLEQFQFDLKNDLAVASAMSLRESKLFADVTEGRTIDLKTADYLWRGKVSNTYYGGSRLSYCVTYLVAWPLWILGAPSGVSENELWVKFELVERVTGKIVWCYDYRGRDYLLHWIYARVGQDTSMYASLMKQAMNQAMVELSRNVPLVNKEK